MGGPIPRPAIERFSVLYEEEPNTGCWLWKGCINRGGYARFYLERGRAVLAHRFAYEHFVGPIPPGLEPDHLCRQRNCVNPAHLEPVTRRENLLRGQTIPARRVQQRHCVNGHEFTAENTTIRRGCRECRTCTLAMKRAAWHRQTPEQRARANARKRASRARRGAMRKMLEAIP